jgi:hypothetical protein
MMTFDSDTLAALASGEVALVQLVMFEFPSGTVAYNTSTYSFTWLAVEYLAGYGLGEISPVRDAAGEVQGMTIQLDAGDPSKLALALDDADQVQGTRFTLRTAVVRISDYQILSAPIDWVGFCDTMSIAEDGSHAAVSVSIESGAVDLIRGSPSTYSDADQQALYPGDLAFQYVVDQIDKPVVWPAKSFFYK